VADGEPLWLEDDQEIVMAWLAERAETCPGCGQLRAESQAVVKDENGRTRQLHLYEAERVECFGCRSISVAAGDDKDNPHPSAQGYVVHKRT
jgi:hypothetical protein